MNNPRTGMIKLKKGEYKAEIVAEYNALVDELGNLYQNPYSVDDCFTEKFRLLGKMSSLLEKK